MTSRTDTEKERDFQAALDEFEAELHAEKGREERRKKAERATPDQPGREGR